MTNARRDGLLLLLLGCALFVSIGTALQQMSTRPLQDFKVVYYGTRCLIQHCDPYREADVLNLYRSDARKWKMLADDPSQSQAISRFLYLPSVSAIVLPFALFPWPIAHVLWMAVMSACLILTALLIWNIAADSAPLLAGALLALLLANSVGLLLIGNSAGIAVSLCVIAVWCFLRHRAVALGVVCMALSLAAKPHDAALVWVFFLLCGGVQRKRALIVALLTIAFCLPSLLWVSHTSPSWLREMRASLAASSAHGGLNDPGPSAASDITPVMVINLQSVVAVFCDDARVYNPITYLICGAMFVAWALGALRSRHRSELTWIALGVLAPLSLLPIYHRPHDSRLLLLTVPACAILWNSSSRWRWLPTVCSALAILMTGDIPLALCANFARHLALDSTTLQGRLLTVLVARPAPVTLLLTSLALLIAFLFRTHLSGRALEPGSNHSTSKASG